MMTDKLTTESLSHLAERITTEHQAACGAARTALEHGYSAGLLLIEARKQLRHGEWLPWLTNNFEFTARTAQNYVRLAEHRPALESKCETVSHLGMREALQLLAAPTVDEPEASLLDLLAAADAIAEKDDLEVLHELTRRARGRIDEIQTMSMPELVRVIGYCENVEQSAREHRINDLVELGKILNEHPEWAWSGPPADESTATV